MKNDDGPRQRLERVRAALVLAQGSGWYASAEKVAATLRCTTRHARRELQALVQQRLAYCLEFRGESGTLLYSTLYPSWRSAGPRASKCESDAARAAAQRVVEAVSETPSVASWREALERVYRLAGEGDLDGAHANLDAARLSTDRLAPKYRTALVAIRDRLRADIAMQRGHEHEAIRHAKRALANDTLRLDERVSTLATLAAALRMRSVRACSDAAKAYEDAMELAETETDPTSRNRMRRHLRAAITAPLIVSGRLREAAQWAESSIDLAANPDESAESLLVLARVQHHLGRHDAANDSWERAEAAGPTQAWLKVWINRFRVSFAAAELDTTELNVGLERAVRAAGSYGFQRLLVLARMVEVRDKLRPEAWSEDGLDVLGSMLGRPASRDLVLEVPLHAPVKVRNFPSLWKT